MRPLQINLASAPWRNQLLPGVLLGVLAVAGLFFSVFNLVAYVANARDAREAAGAVTSLRETLREVVSERERLQEQLGRVDLAVLGEQVGLANRLLRKRGLSWTHLFNEMEQLQPYNVQLYSIRPSVQPKGIQLSVRAQAMTVDDEYEYINRLEASPSFSAVYPLNEQLENRKVNFNMTMIYHPDVAERRDRDGVAEPEPEPAPGEVAVEPAGGSS
jgi:hypothetical protein